jgi:hypothetical protein
MTHHKTVSIVHLPPNDPFSLQILKETPLNYQKSLNPFASEVYEPAKTSKRTKQAVRKL